MRKGLPRAVSGLVIGLTLLGAACGGDDDSSSAATTASEGGVTTASSAAPTAASSGASTTAAGAGVATGGIVPGADPEVDKVVASYSAVFDSSVPYDAKAAHLAEAEALRPTVEAYSAAGSRFGGIKLVPTAVVINGDQAAVTYDVLFGTATQYRALKGEALREAGAWKVSREEFCSFMASARTPCPTS